MSELFHGNGRSLHDYRTARTPELKRRIRITGLTIGAVVLVVIAFSVVYVSFWGGVNKGPMEPLRNSVRRDMGTPASSNSTTP